MHSHFQALNYIVINVLTFSGNYLHFRIINTFSEWNYTCTLYVQYEEGTYISGMYSYLHFHEYFFVKGCTYIFLSFSSSRPRRCRRLWWGQSRRPCRASPPPPARSGQPGHGAQAAAHTGISTAGAERKYALNTLESPRSRCTNCNTHTGISTAGAQRKYASNTLELPLPHQHVPDSRVTVH